MTEKKPWQSETLTGFYAFSLHPEIGQFSPHFWDPFLTKLHSKPGVNGGKKHWRKWKKIQWRRRREIADFCPLSWSNVSWEEDNKRCTPNSGKSQWGLCKWGLSVLVHNCPRLPTLVVILWRKFPLEMGPERPQKCTIVRKLQIVA